MELAENSPEMTKYFFLTIRVKILLISLGKTTQTAAPLQIWPACT